MCHLRYRLRIFLFHGKVMFRSRDILSFCIFNHPMIYQICDVILSISTWDRLHFWIYLLNHHSLTHQTWSIDRHKQGQYFPEIFWRILRTGAKFQALFNLVICSKYSITNYIKFSVYQIFEKVNEGELKMVNVY